MAIVVATATFDGTQDSVAVLWSSAFSAAPGTVTYGIGISDGGGVIDCDVTSVTATGCTVEPSARFTGVVELIASD
jgi:hypothetical protein